MQINLGDFGYRGTSLSPVHTENPEALAGPQAERQAAQSTMQAQEVVQQGLREQSQAAENRAQAGIQVGNTLAGIGSNLVEYAQNLARQKAEIQLQDYQTFKQGVLQGISDKVQNGELDSAGIQKAYGEGMKGWKGEDIPDLTGSDLMRLQKGMATVNRQGDQTVYSLYSRQLHAEGVNALEQTAAGYTQQMMQPGADVTAISGQIDELYNRSSTKALLGASWANQYQSAKKNLATTFYSSQIEANNDDNGALSTLKEDINNSSAKGVLDLQTRTSLFNTIDTKMSRNEARAQAAQNHADSVATRREVAAVHASDQMNLRIARGEIPAEGDWKKLEQTTSGTSVAGEISGQYQAMVATQTVLKMKPSDAQSLIDQRRQELQTNGGTANDYKVLDATEQAVKQRVADLKNNPQRVAATDAGSALVPVAFVDAIDAPGQFGAGLQQRLNNSIALTTKYGETAGKDLLTTDERNDFKTGYEKLTPDQKVQFWRNTNASAGPEATRRLSREVGEGSGVVSQVAPLANTPAGYAAAAAVTKGEALLNPTDGSPKVKAPKDEDLIAEIKRRYPDMPQAQVQNSVQLVRAQHVGLGKRDTDIPTTEDMEAVLGAPVKVFGSKIVAPAGIKGDVFSDAMTTAVNKLPATDAANIRNNLSDDIYGFIEDASGNMRLINKTTNRAVTLSNGKPYVVDLSHVR